MTSYWFALRPKGVEHHHPFLVFDSSDQHQVSREERAQLGEVPECFRQFWNDQETTVRERKRVLRLLIEDVTVHKAEQIVAHIRAHREA